MDISPFIHTPKLPDGVVTIAPLSWLCAVALGLGAAGLAGLRRRDTGDLGLIGPAGPVRDWFAAYFWVPGQ